MFKIISPSICIEEHELLAAVQQQAQGLRALKSPSEPLGIYADLSLPGLVLTLAAISAEIPVAICSTREPASAIQAWLQTLGIKKLVSACRAPKISEMAAQVYTVDEFSLLSRSSSSSATANAPGFCSMLRTSGTTAWPKTALLTARAHEASAQGVAEYFSLGPQSVFALSLPLYHVSGLSILFRCQYSKASIFLASTYEQILWGLAQKKITHISLVPAQLKRLLDDQADLSALTAIIVGGDALSQKLRDEALDKKLPLYECYGLCESASMVWVGDVGNERGQCLSHAKIKLNAQNEILVGGQSLFAGYIEAFGLNPALDSDGFFATGDLASPNYINYLRVFGRTHNRIISGGENIQAEELEAAFESHPQIELCVIVAVKDESLGARPLAIVKYRSPCIDQDHLIAHLRTHVAAYKIPKQIIKWPNNAPEALKKPRKWLSDWVRDQMSVTKLS